MKPRKHHEIIIAWANGSDIEARPIDGVWVDCSAPTFQDNFEYRIKPEKKVIQYRRYLCKTDSDYIVGTLNYHEYVSIVLETMQLQNTFIRWIDTDWQEVEV